MRITITALCTLTIILLSACSNTPKYIVDVSPSERLIFEQDISECEALADQVDTSGEIAEGTLTGAAVGAVIGGVSDGARGAGRGAAAGGVLGALGGAGGAHTQKNLIARKCLENRGWVILN